MSQSLDIRCLWSLSERHTVCQDLCLCARLQICEISLIIFQIMHCSDKFFHRFRLTATRHRIHAHIQRIYLHFPAIAKVPHCHRQCILTQPADLLIFRLRRTQIIQDQRIGNVFMAGISLSCLRPGACPAFFLLLSRRQCLGFRGYRHRRKLPEEFLPLCCLLLIDFQSLRCLDGDRQDPMHCRQLGYRIPAIPHHLVIIGMYDMELSVLFLPDQRQIHIQFRTSLQEGISILPQPVLIIFHFCQPPHPVSDLRCRGENMTDISKRSETAFFPAVRSVGEIAVTGIEAVTSFCEFSECFRPLAPVPFASVQFLEFRLQFLRDLFRSVEPCGLRDPESPAAPLLYGCLFTGLLPVLHMLYKSFRQLCAARRDQCGIITG